MLPGLTWLAEYPKAFMKIAVLPATLLDQFAIGLTGQSPLAPAPLRWRVHGTPDLASFLEVGEQCANDIATALRNAGKPLDRFSGILDFGCGCGRVLTHLRKHAPQARFYGTDIDADAIEWCAANLNCAGFTVNRAEPPLEFSAGQFDLVYAISIFTHLDQAAQFLWLEELQRVTKPGGIVLLTLHGRHCWQSLPPATVAKIELDGIAVIDEPFMKLFSPLYHTNAYHARDYVEQQFGKYFHVLDYLPRGLNHHQDIVLLEKPDAM
jgi:ubiquinone/menaquinone biosynthesis C-methylase UbiE